MGGDILPDVDSSLPEPPDSTLASRDADDGGFKINLAAAAIGGVAKIVQG